MRKTCRRVKRGLGAPTMVALYLNPEVSTQERMAVVALRQGFASTDQFNVLADCRDMMTLAAGEKNDAQTLAVCELARVALENLKDRYREIGRIGATGDEIRALQLLVEVSEDFWKRQPGRLFVDADKALGREREMAREAARAGRVG